MRKSCCISEQEYTLLELLESDEILHAVWLTAEKCFWGCSANVSTCNVVYCMSRISAWVATLNFIGAGIIFIQGSYVQEVLGQPMIRREDRTCLCVVYCKIHLGMNWAVVQWQSPNICEGLQRGRLRRRRGSDLCSLLLVPAASTVFYPGVTFSWLSWLLYRKLYCQCWSKLPGWTAPSSDSRWRKWNTNTELPGAVFYIVIRRVQFWLLQYWY